MNALRRILLLLLVLSAVHGASAQETRRVPSIGLAIPVDPGSDAPYQQAFREGLRELGYVDGKNVNLIVRYSRGDPAKYREIIRELIALRVDVLWGEAGELKEETTTIPIVSPTMGFGDPVRLGLVASLAKPGGNLTGPSTQRHDIDPKLLQLTKELIPELRRLCLLYDGRPQRNLRDYAENEFRALARGFGVSVCMIPIQTQDDVEAVPRIIEQRRPQAVMFWISEFMYQHHRALIAPIARRLPVVGDLREVALVGAVLVYSADRVHQFKRSAVYIDKILKGAKPGDLPIEQPTQFKLILNLKTADALGIKVPESIQVLADESIR
jgi:putative tryptophan/tyrosine transport system substrate-binding protein